MNKCETTPIILIAIETLGGGGAERVALDLARTWPREHARPVLLVASRVGVFAECLPYDIEVIEIGVTSSPRNLITFLKRLRNAVRDRLIAGVISHMTPMNRMLLRSALFRIIRSPIVVVEHNDFVRNFHLAQMSRLRSLLLLWETGFLYRRAVAVVGCSIGVAQQIKTIFRLPQNRMYSIANPVAPCFAIPTAMDSDTASWFSKLPRPVFVSSGRMVQQKGFDDLLRAFSLLKHGSLVILGDGPLRSRLFTLANELGITSRIYMPGFHRAPEMVLQAADVYVSASHWEGYPLVLIEAYASGLPVVARACNFGPDEIVTSDRPGRLVRTLKIEDLALAMAEVAASTPRFAPGTILLPENDIFYVVNKYRALFSTGENQ